MSLIDGPAFNPALPHSLILERPDGQLEAFKEALRAALPNVPVGHPFYGLNKAQRRALAISNYWRLGNLEYKLLPYQKVIRQQFRDSQANSRTFVLKCSRRIGKTYLLVCMALEAALAKPRQRIKYAAAAAKDVEDMIKPIVEEVLLDCPANLMPKCTWYKGLIEFGNGSVIRLNGCDDEAKANSLRGQAADLVIIDEAGFIKPLEYVVQSVLFPQLLTTNGRMMVASSPATSPAHYFAKMFHSADANGAGVKMTIYDALRYGNPFLSERIIAEYCDQAGGDHTTVWKREYLAEDVIDSSIAILPNWNEEIEPEIVKETPRPDFYDCYTSFDPGFRDGAGALFAHYDFLKATVVIEDEVLLFKKDSGIQMAAIRGKEKQLWPDREPFLRVSDNDSQLIADYYKQHGMHFSPTAKDDKEAALNHVDLLIRQRKLVINPRCKQLIKQLHTTVWNKAHTSYERNEDGHGDLLDALVYLVRNINRSRNPYPPEAMPNRDTHRIPSGYYSGRQRFSPEGAAFRKIFGKG